MVGQPPASLNSVNNVSEITGYQGWHYNEDIHLRQKLTFNADIAQEWSFCFFSHGLLSVLNTAHYTNHLWRLGGEKKTENIMEYKWPESASSAPLPLGKA